MRERIVNKLITNHHSDSRKLRSSTSGSSSQSGLAKAEGIMTKSKAKCFVVAAAAAVASLLGSSRANAGVAPITLNDGNSTVVIDPSTSAGLDSWTIGNNTNQVKKEWFWYRVGSGSQSSLDQLGLSGATSYDTNGNGQNDTEKLTYGSPTGLQVVVTYSLVGGQANSGTSDIGETIKITNNGATPLNYHFFEYTNFSLGGSTNGQTVTIANGNTATDQGNGEFAQIVVSPKPSEFEANIFPTLLTTELTNTSNYTLSDTASAPSGNGESGFEWDLALNSGQSYVISIDKQIHSIPEPSSEIALLGLGGLLLTRPRRRDEDPDPRTVVVAEA